MITQFNDFIKNGDFRGAAELIASLKERELSELINHSSVELESLSIYVFVVYLITQKETAELHSLASTLLATDYCHIEGAYYLAFEHGKRALELAPGHLDLLVWMLFFYEVPDKLLTKEDAKKIVDEVLEIDPNNNVALRLRTEVE